MNNKYLALGLTLATLLLASEVSANKTLPPPSKSGTVVGTYTPTVPVAGTAKVLPGTGFTPCKSFSASAC